MSLIESITVENLDHLGIVAGLIDEIGIVELINQKLGVDNREKNYYWTSNKSFNFELVRDGLTSIIFI